ncbi:hypothetical protein Bca101_030893 [Brassica carinata]
MATSFVFIVGWKAGRCNNVVEVRLLRFSEACNRDIGYNHTNVENRGESKLPLRPIPDFGDDGSNGLGDNIHRATSLTSTLSLGHAHNANEPYVDPVAMHPLRLLPPSSNASKKAHSG